MRVEMSNVRRGVGLTGGHAVWCVGVGRAFARRDTNNAGIEPRARWGVAVVVCVEQGAYIVGLRRYSVRGLLQLSKLRLDGNEWTRGGGAWSSKKMRTHAEV